MKSLAKACLLLLATYVPVKIFAQKDSLWLQCPLENATVVAPSKTIIHFDQPDLSIVLVSIPDTLAKACVEGRVTNVEQTDDGKWDVVFKYRDYYFWYSGITKPLVRRNENIKTGQPVGTVPTGNKMEMLLYKFETQLDPARFLECTRGMAAK